MTDPSQHSPAQINRDVAFIYEGFNRKQLLVQKCTSCGALRHPPGPLCLSCHLPEWTPIEASGRGVLHSYTIHHHPPIPPWSTPHAIALADMAEGFRFLAAVLETDPAHLAIGQPLRIAFIEASAGYMLPYFTVEDAS